MVNGPKQTQIAPNTLIMSDVVLVGRVPTTPTTQQHIAPQPTQERVAVLVLMPTFQTTLTNISNYFKCTPKPRCLLSKLRKDGSTGPGVPSQLHSGATVQHGRMASCQKRHTPLPSNAATTCLTSLACRNITDFHDPCRKTCICYIAAFLAVLHLF